MAMTKMPPITETTTIIAMSDVLDPPLVLLGVVVDVVTDVDVIGVVGGD